MTVIGHHVWTSSTPDEQKIFAGTMKEAAVEGDRGDRDLRRVLATQLKKLGMTVVEPDREAFRKAALPLHNDASAGRRMDAGAIRRVAVG